MKKVLVLAVAMLLVTAGVSFAAISGSAHDMTAYGAGDTMSSCQYCHTPHLRSNPAVTGAPLWNRTLGTAGSWTMYGATIAGTAMNANPGNNSRTCLSCHDGTVAVGTVLVGNADTIVDAGAVLDATGKIEAARNANLGTNLTNEHPVGFVVNAAVAGLDTIANMVTAGFKFYNGGTEMECATCHDPHNTTNAPFLRVAKATICTACHVSK